MGERQAKARRHADLFAHEVLAENAFGHRVFDLQAGVHLDEIELAVLIEELDRARAGIAHLADCVGADLADAGALFGGDAGAGGLFENLLVAALERAIALAEVYALAHPVAKDLNFDVTRLLEIFLHIDFVIAEGGLGLGTSGEEGGFDFLLGFRDLHAAPAAAGGGLDDDRIAHLGGDALGGAEIGHATVRARNDGDSEFLGGVLGGDLVAHQADVLGRGADEGQAVILDRLHESRVFRQEAIAGVDRLSAGDLAGRDDRGEAQIALRRRVGADADGLIRHANVHRIGIGGGMHRNRFDPHFTAGAHDPKSDLSAVGD